MLILSSKAATIVYSENFNSYPAGSNTLPTGFTEGGTEGTTTRGNSSAVTISSGGGYRFEITGATAAYSSVR